MNTDQRIRDLLLPAKNRQSLIQLIGFPSDKGVQINGGRTGAAKAPELVFEQLMKLTPHAQYLSKHVSLLHKTANPQILNCSGNLEIDQPELGEKIGEVLTENQIPIIVGGGHETSYGHFLGYVKAGKEVDIINIDAHTDVRHLKQNQAHSGSPFRQALLHPSGLCKSYNVYGLNPSSVSAEHLKFVQKHGKAHFESDTELNGILDLAKMNNSGNIMVTMDMDVVSQGEAPGVSAPNASGISRNLWLSIAFEFGKLPNVTSFDLCEVNPGFDRDHQTVKLAALTIWYFLLGVSLR